MSHHKALNAIPSYPHSCRHSTPRGSAATCRRTPRLWIDTIPVPRHELIPLRTVPGIYLRLHYCSSCMIALQLRHAQKQSLKSTSGLLSPIYSFRPRRIHTSMSEASSFPPSAVRDIVAEVATLLKERKESISVAETVWTARSIVDHAVAPLVLSASYLSRL